eukprot:scaffold117179_cov28-Tisochrysis_lutea.AAC.3
MAAQKEAYSAKPSDLGGALLSHYSRVLGGAEVGPAARAACSRLQATREKLAPLNKVSETSAEAALSEFLAYEWELAALCARLDEGGAELGCLFRWRDAWRPRNKCEKPELEWERACVLFNGGAAASFAAGCALGRARGEVKEAVRLYQQAAGCLVAAHGIVRPAIWGLTPRWDPNSLPVEMTLDMLDALRDVMLAQVRRRTAVCTALLGKV